jgi:hypothetical protein
VRFLALWLAAPPLLTIAVSPWKPLFFSRYMVMCVPALVMLAAHGLARFISIRGLARAAASAALVLLILISGWGTERYFGASFHQTEDWRGAAGYILSQQRAGDGALFYIPNIYSYTYYVQHLQTRNQSQPAILYPSTPRHSLTPELIKQATAGRRRVWLVLCNESVNPAAAGMIETTMDKSFTPVETKIFAGEDPITLILYSQPAPASE